MNILIVGATRGIGRELVEQALASSGNSVTALARHPERLAAQHERLRKVHGDILGRVHDRVAAFHRVF